jgi:hypothetical protein
VYLSEASQLVRPQVLPSLTHGFSRYVETPFTQVGAGKRDCCYGAAFSSQHSVKIANLLDGAGLVGESIEHSLPVVIRNRDHAVGLW